MFKPVEDGSWQWGREDSGLTVGLRLNRRSTGGGIDIVGAALNKSHKPHYLSGEYSLQVKSVDGQPNIIGGPRSGEPIPITPGQEVEFASWRLREDALEPGHYSFVLIYRSESGHQIESGKVDLSVGGASFLEEPT